MIDGIQGTDEELEDLDIGFGGEQLPEKNDKIALIDADTVAFTACLAAQEELADGEFIIDDTEALKIAEEKIQRILDRTGCMTAELHFTGGRENFRYAIFPEYKANRTKEGAAKAPVGLKECKANLMERYDSTMSLKWEADDMVVHLKAENPDKYIMCAIDKDVIKCLPGRHFNYYESRHFNKDMHFVEVAEGEARMWPYLQCILGDTSDNVPGVKGLGPKKALKFVNENMTHEELWEGVCRAWDSKGLTEEAATLTMQLVNMHCLVKDGENFKIDLWSPKGSEDE